MLRCSFCDPQGHARLTLVLFDDIYDVILDGVPLAEVLELNDDTYVPRGMTALLDAVGRTVDSVALRLAETPEAKRPEKVIFCILTDGEENASKEYKREQVFKKISSHTENNGWEFIFLAANQDAIATGESMGIAGDNSINFDATSSGVHMAYSMLSDEVIKRRRKP
ncbi:MAG: hypothetical protein NT018_07980 [Armatimonadetes bacterium]|nr:hypothetical protein [Armatimonadota bacterium]